MPKYGNMAKNPKTNLIQIMPLTQKDASHQYWPIYEVKSLFTRNGPRRPFFWHKISHYVGTSPREKKKSSERAAEIALRASYTIYLSRTNKIWSDNWELVQVPKEE